MNEEIWDILDSGRKFQTEPFESASYSPFSLYKEPWYKVYDESIIIQAFQEHVAPGRGLTENFKKACMNTHV